MKNKYLSLIYEYVFYYLSQFHIPPQYVLDMTISDVETYMIKSNEKINAQVRTIKQQMEKQNIATTFTIDITDHIS